MAKLSKKQQELNNELRNNCAYGRLDEVKELISQGADFNAPNAFDNSALKLAYDYQHPEVVKYLVTLIKKEDFNAGWAMYWAGRFGHFDVIQELFKKGFAIQEGFVAACSTGRLDIIKYLIENGADINVPDKYGDFAIMEAVKEGEFKVIEYFIEQNIDIGDINSLIKLASERGKLDLVKCLHRNGGDIDLAIENARNPKKKEELIAYKTSLEEKILLENDLKDVVLVKKPKSILKD